MSILTTIFWIAVALGWLNVGWQVFAVRNWRGFSIDTRIAIWTAAFGCTLHAAYALVRVLA